MLFEKGHTLRIGGRNFRKFIVHLRARNNSGTRREITQRHSYRSHSVIARERWKRVVAKKERTSASARSPYVPLERRRLYISLRDATAVITYTQCVYEAGPHELASPYNNGEPADESGRARASDR